MLRAGILPLRNGAPIYIRLKNENFSKKKREKFSEKPSKRQSPFFNPDFRRLLNLTIIIYFNYVRMSNLGKCRQDD